MYGPQRRATDERIVHEAKAATHFIETLRGMMAIKLNLRESERRSAYLNHVVDQTNADVRVQNLALLQRAGNVLVFGIENVSGDLARRLRRARQPVVGRHAVRLPAVQAAVHHARQQPGRQDDRVPHARSARRPRCRHCAGRARGRGRVARSGARRCAISALRVAGARHRIRLRHRGVCVPRRRLCRQARRDGRDRRTQRRREDHASQGAGGLARPDRGVADGRRP